MNKREQLTERFDKGHLSYSSIKHALGDMRVWEMYKKAEASFWTAEEIDLAVRARPALPP